MDGSDSGSATGNDANQDSKLPTTQMPMMFAPPAITAAILPRPDTPQKQSAEEWFRVFRAVAENLIEIYRNAGQEVVGQRQALAAIPSLLNRTEGESRLATRILAECQNLKEAGELIRQTIGDLESECQATELLFNIKRGSTSLEDFYAQLVEKDRKARLGRTVVIKKFIAELPDGVKVAAQKQYQKLRQNADLEVRQKQRQDAEFTKEEVDSIYALCRRVYQEKFGSKMPLHSTNEAELVLTTSD